MLLTTERMRGVRVSIVCGEPHFRRLRGRGRRTHLVFQASDDAVVDTYTLVKEVLPALESKGGGKAKSAQGSVSASAQWVVDLVESVLVKRL